MKTFQKVLPPGLLPPWSTLQCPFAPSLVLLFGSVDGFKQGDARVFGETLPEACLISASTAGSIAGERLVDPGWVISAVQFDQVKVTAVIGDVQDLEDSRAAGRRVAQQLSARLQASGVSACNGLWLFGPGVGVNGSALVDGVREHFADVPLAGGLAGDDAQFTGSYTGLGADTGGNKVVLVGFSGPVKWSNASAGGWEAFGPARQITEVEGNVVFSIDGRPALDLYREYLGEHANELPASGLLFPFQLVERDGQARGLIRTLLGIDDERGALIFAGDFRQADSVRLMHASTMALTEGARRAAEMARETTGPSSPGLALLVSCVGRRLVMGDVVEDEIETVIDALGGPKLVTGFYSNGEIGLDGFSGDCSLHNQTMTVVCLDEEVS